MFSHTIFSLSFALISMLLAAGGKLPFYTIFWIIVAFLGGRKGENALNKVIDAEIDAKNPRTAQTIVVGAHMDGVQCAAANDNATGTVSIVEAARILSQPDVANNLKYNIALSA